MTSRRGTLVEEGARELLQVCGYAVRIVPSGYHKRYPPAHLVATRPSGGTRFIRVRKISHRTLSAGTVAEIYSHDIARFRRYLSLHPGCSGLRCELWVYSLTCGFRCFEILPDSIREIRKPSPGDVKNPGTGGTA
ncbi:hypothetical protein [uncultured Methanoregula sp.]|uniref:hypothetical protein n=1 Tax=uncultured Methanoregula sp. TaxID=1005933 RepID=UPI002AAAC313|nr:hypothetical protein [uncultured Methanoregula sp.]